MDCEKLRNCELRLRKIAISQQTQFIFLSAGRNRNITQFDFLEGRNCEFAKNCEIGEKTIFVSRIQPILVIFLKKKIDLKEQLKVSTWNIFKREIIFFGIVYNVHVYVRIIIFIKSTHCKIPVFEWFSSSKWENHNFSQLFAIAISQLFAIAIWFWKLDRNFATNTIWFSTHFTTLPVP